MEPKDGVLPGRSRPEVDVNGKLCVSPFSCHLGAAVKDPGHPGVTGDRGNGVCEGALGGRSGTPAPSRSGPPGAPPGPQTSAWRPELPSEAPAPRRAAARAQRPAARDRQSREVGTAADFQKQPARCGRPGGPGRGTWPRQALCSGAGDCVSRPSERAHGKAHPQPGGHATARVWS